MNIAIVFNFLSFSSFVIIKMYNVMYKLACSLCVLHVQVHGLVIFIICRNSNFHNVNFVYMYLILKMP